MDYWQRGCSLFFFSPRVQTRRFGTTQRHEVESTFSEFRSCGGICLNHYFPGSRIPEIAVIFDWLPDWGESCVAASSAALDEKSGAEALEGFPERIYS
jgi:hypothetical protein